MAKSKTIRWLDKPEAHDYLAAASYLSLLFDENKVEAYKNELLKAVISQFKAKDIFRASGLPLLGVSNSHVQKDRKKITAGKQLSPLLLVRDCKRGAVIIADGYHRLCSVYSYNEDAVIPCKIV